MIYLRKPVFFITLFLIIQSSPAISSELLSKDSANSNSVSPSQDKINKAVWRISNSYNTGTAFFISENHIITNYHVIADLIKNSKSLKTTLLFYKETTKRFQIKKIVSASSYYDLALLEVEGSHTNFLTLPESKSVDCDKNQLYALGYPDRHFHKINQVGPVLHNSMHIDYRDILNGISGGPVLDHCESLKGVSFIGFNNQLSFIPLEDLSSFLKDESLLCETLDPNLCLKSNHIKELDYIKTGKYKNFLSIGNHYYKREENLKLAIEWYEKSAEEGNTLAQSILGLIYSLEEDVKDLNLTIYWLKKAIELGDINAQVQLGKIYSSEEDLKDLNLAIHWLEKSARQGDSRAQFELGTIYLTEESIQNLDLAIEWLEKSAEQGDSRAQFNLGTIYLTEENIQNLDLAIEWLEKSARQGFILAQLNLGQIYLTKKSVKDLNLAIYWLEKSAEQGDNEAQLNLAWIYLNEESAKDLNLAIYWLEKSAEQGDNEAQFNLAGLYLTLQNLELAIHWFEKSAEQGDRDAQFNLGMIYFTTESVQNSDLAIYWLEKSAEQGDNEAQEILDTILNSRS